MQKVYKNKESGQVIVTSEKLDKKHWEFLRNMGEMKVKNGQMNKKRIIKK